MLEAALCLVDLKYEEANDAPQVVAMVANGEIDLALKRIESFGGADKEGVKRKFILYMLCLMELTLLDSKDKPFCKSSIEKLLNHLDEQIPPDTSLIEWNDFFPSLTIFFMASEWAKMGLNYSIIYKRTAEWENDWIKDSGPFDDFNFQVLTESARGISNVNIKSKVLNYISTELWIQGKLEECLSVMQESFACALDISDEYHKNSTLEHIAAELARQDKLEESLACARGISDQSHKSRALLAISTELVKQGKLEEALEYALGIIDESHKSRALVVISTELSKQGKIEEAIACTLGISDERAKNKALKDISTELFKQGNNK
jgi:tetratricopeptide (TPR) repeat protein